MVSLSSIGIKLEADKIRDIFFVFFDDITTCLVKGYEQTAVFKPVLKKKKNILKLHGSTYWILRVLQLTQYAQMCSSTLAP